MGNKSKEDKWLDELKSIDIGNVGTFGVEVTTRIILRDAADLQYVEEVLENGRQYGASEITAKVRL